MKKCKGITLIALVITIIVLLILAGVSLNLIAGEQGILKRATSAVDKNKVETVKEDVELVVADLGTGYYEEKYDKGSQNFSDVDDYIESQFGTNREMFDGSQAKIKKKKVEVSQDGKLVATGVLENGKILWDANPKEKPLPMEPTAVFAKLYEDGTLILSSTDYTDPDREVRSDYGDISNSEEMPGWITIEEWNGPRSSASSIIIYDKIAPTSTKGWFIGLKKEEISNFENLNTSNVTNMDYMFSACNDLTSLDLSSFDTSNVTSMREMFAACYNLTSLDLSSFNTSNVTNMDYMFSACNDLTSLDLSSFDTSNVTNMSYMFNYCNSLSNLNLSSFDTSNVTDMERMFSYCSSLTELDLSSFDISNVTDMNNMFSQCENLEVIWVRNQAMKEKFESNANLKFEIKPTR